MAKRKKVVFILGAGFSVPALDLPQSQLLKKINKDKKHKSLINAIGKIWNDPINVPLEDVYTLFDRSVEKQESVGSFSSARILKLRNDLNDAIAEIHSIPVKKEKKKYVEDFARKLCALRWEYYDRGLKKKKATHGKYRDDRVAVISTNWDVLLEEQLGKTMQENNYKLKRPILGTTRGMFMDFCMFEFQLDKNKPFTPAYIPTSLRIKPHGFANLKFLKLHGGINWFQCPRCDGVIVNLTKRDSYTPNYKDKDCLVCLKNYQDYSHKTSALKRFFISPTFLKDFNATHFRSIWWNASYEIAEASHLVFIGYSLPLSDYDLRHLISKNINKDTHVTSILHSNDCSDIDYMRACKNYQDFFGGKATIEKYGIEDFVNKGHMDKILDSARD